MPQVRIPPPYQGPTQGVDVVRVGGATVEECIREVDRRYPGFGAQIFDADGSVHRFVTLFVNGDAIERAALDTAIDEGDEVEILAAIAGG